MILSTPWQGLIQEKKINIWGGKGTQISEQKFKLKIWGTEV